MTIKQELDNTKTCNLRKNYVQRTVHLLKQKRVVLREDLNGSEDKQALTFGMAWLILNGHVKFENTATTTTYELVNKEFI